MERAQSVADRPHALGDVRVADRGDGLAVPEQVAELLLLAVGFSGTKAAPARTIA